MPLEDDVPREQQIIESLIRSRVKELGLSEAHAGVWVLLEQGYKQREVAEEFGKSRSWVKHIKADIGRALQRQKRKKI